MAYKVDRAAGPWLPGDTVEEEDLKAHPFHEKFLKSGSIRKENASDKAADDEKNQARRAELQQRISELQAELDTLDGLTPNATAPGAVRLEVDPENPPTREEATDTRAAGKEVVQPTPGDPNLGEIVPGESAPDTDADKKNKKQ